MRTNDRPVHQPLSAVLLAIVLLAIPAFAHAQELANQIGRVTAGPFDITVLANPVSPLEGLGSRLSVRVLQAAGGSPVTDADVQIVATRPDGTSDSIAAARLPANPGWYEVPIGFRQVGGWNLTVVVNSPAGLATLDVPITVQKAPSGGAQSEIAWVVMLLVLAGFAYLAWRSLRPKHPQSQPPV